MRNNFFVKYVIKAAVALYDTDYNIELACLKVLEAGDAGEGDSNWATVEKPQKKEPKEEKPIVSN